MTGARPLSWRLGLAVAALGLAAPVPAAAEEPCSDLLATCTAGCRAGTFIGDPARRVCITACGERERTCRQSAAGPCAPAGTCPPDPATRREPGRHNSRLQP
ncbi:MAG: hypothetical protein PGN34_08815 [Methylobacterium frigidaeris]